MVNSMTGFAAAEGGEGDWRWSWDMRAVNARGLDLRFRLPDRAQALEPPLRSKLQAALGRGSVQVGLKLSQEGGAGRGLDGAALSAAVAQVAEARQALERAGIEAAPADPVALLSLPGVLTGDTAPDLPAAALMGDFDAVLDAFAAMRAEEGAALVGILSEQLARVEALVAEARTRAGARAGEAQDRFAAQVAKLTEAAGAAADPDRLSHDLAALIVRGDVSEELDRLTAHVDAARGFLAAEGPVGRKLDFLMQEFNREANTLCSKSADTELTRVGLDLKVVVDQMREQVQNLE
ncbi:YicC family protein [Rhodobacterales bacterium HKCCE2091]|nr:YicC family protein [Rhodobacterales bacterium HKCCE2091]